MEGTTPIPAFGAEERASVARDAVRARHLASSWARLTRLVADRLDLGAGTSRLRTRLYRDGEDYVAFALRRPGEFSIEFGRIGAAAERIRLGRLHAYWDELGINGPYRISMRGRDHALGTFAAVLDHYLTLPEIA